MDLLLILSYAAICVAFFKVFKIPLNKWTVPTAVLGGIILIGSLIMAMNYNHPYSEVTRQYFVSTPVIPSVRGEVISVNVKANMPITAGHLLFTIDPEPYKNKVDAIKAQIVSAELDNQRAIELMKKHIGKQRDVDITRATLDNLIATLKNAEYYLKQTQVRAVSDGYVTQMLVHPGLYVVPMPFRPAMVFVQQDSFTYIGWYRQNSSMRLEVGNEAEVAFDALPGKIFSAQVMEVMPVLAEGELQASGNMISLNLRDGVPGRIPVKIKITDTRFTDLAKFVPGGSYGQSAIYSEHLQHVAIMRKVLLRMSSWMSYLFPFH